MQTCKHPLIRSIIQHEIDLSLLGGGRILNETYARPFRGLLSSIAQIYPQTASLLEALEAQFGGLAAFHATEVILTLQARVDTWGSDAASVLTEDDLEALPYFDIMADNLSALELLVDILECHAAECQQLYAQGVR